jgi:hypothetical protein
MRRTGVFYARVWIELTSRNERPGVGASHRIDEAGASPEPGTWTRTRPGRGSTRPNRLTATPVTDAGLVHVQHLTGLRHLLQNGTRNTDAGLAHPAALKSRSHSIPQFGDVTGGQTIASASRSFRQSGRSRNAAKSDSESNLLRIEASLRAARARSRNASAASAGARLQVSANVQAAL